jgi:hypothetical protein
MGRESWVTVRLDAGERALLDGLAAAEDRPVSVMARRLIVAGLQASPGVQPVPVVAGSAREQSRSRSLLREDAVRAAGEGGPSVTQAQLLDPRQHGFTPQSQNVWRCETCGRKKGEHRG